MVSSLSCPLVPHGAVVYSGSPDWNYSRQLTPVRKVSCWAIEDKLALHRGRGIGASNHALPISPPKGGNQLTALKLDYSSPW